MLGTTTWPKVARASQTTQSSRVRGSRVVERGHERHGHGGAQGGGGGARRRRGYGKRGVEAPKASAAGVRGMGRCSARALNIELGALSLEGQPVQGLGRRRHRKHRARHRQCLQGKTTHFHVPAGRRPGMSACLMSASGGRRRGWASFPKICEVVSMAPRKLRTPHGVNQAIMR